MSTQEFNFQGGSQSDSIAKGTHVFGLFKPGTEVVWPSTKKQNRRVRYLPARNSALARTDSAYLGSVVSYRLRGSSFVDEDTKTEAFAPWYQTLLAHRNVGRGQEDFVSPMMLASAGMSGVAVADPLIDCFNTAIAMRNPAWLVLTERTKDSQGREIAAVLSRNPRALVVANTIFTDTPGNANTYKNAIAVTTPTSHRQFKDSLSRRTPAGVRPLDPDWPQYLLGDVTSPLYGLLGWFEKKQVGTVEAWLLRYSTHEYEAPDAMVFPIPENHPVLLKRYELGSSATLNIPSYQDIVSWLATDGGIPRELIAHACSHLASVPAGGPQGVTHFPGSSAPQGAPAAGLGVPQQGFYPVTQPAGFGFAGSPGGTAAPLGFAGAPAGFAQPVAGLPVSEVEEVEDEEDTAVAPTQHPVVDRVFFVFHPQLGPAPVEKKQSEIMAFPADALAACQVIPKDHPTAPWAPAIQYGLVAQAPLPAAPVAPPVGFVPAPPVQPVSQPVTPTPGFGAASAAPVAGFGSAPAPAALAPAAGFGMQPAAPVGFGIPAAMTLPAAPAGFAAPAAQPTTSAAGPAFTPSAPTTPPLAPTQPTPTGGSLTPEERARYEELTRLSQTNPASLKTPDFKELAMLSAKAQNG